MPKLDWRQPCFSGVRMIGTTNKRILILIALLLVFSGYQAVAIAQAANPHVVVNAFRLNVRSGPGVAHDIITTVAGGTELPVTMLSSDRKWYEVTSSVGTGWVRSAYSVPRGDFSGVAWAGAPPSLATGTGNIPSNAPHLVINTAYLNVRTGPGVGHDIMTAVRGGTELAVTGIDSGRVWYQVETSVGTGWVNSNYTVGRGVFSAVPLAGGAPVVRDTTPQPAMPEGSAHLVVNTAFLNVRSGPGAHHDIITTVPGGTELAVLSIYTDNTWYEVNTAAGAGWVHSGYTVGRGDFSHITRKDAPLSGSVPRVVVNTSHLNIRSGPAIGHGIILSVPGGTTLAVVGVSTDGKWFLVEGDFGQGWLRNLFSVFRGDYGQVAVVS